MNPLHPQEQASTYSWAQASEAKTDEDYRQVEAWLDALAKNRQVKVVRCTADGGRIARHKVLILDGEVISVDIGGYASMAELKRGSHGGTEWLHKVEPLADGWVRIEVMITDLFPEHAMFQRPNGTKVDLGFNDNEHYYMFPLVICGDDLTDAF
jgi:hypothetical protein